MKLRVLLTQYFNEELVSFIKNNLFNLFFGLCPNPHVDIINATVTSLISFESTCKKYALTYVSFQPTTHSNEKWPSRNGACASWPRLWEDWWVWEIFGSKMWLVFVGMKYDSTGMFHWTPARPIEDCIMDRHQVESQTHPTCPQINFSLSRPPWLFSMAMWLSVCLLIWRAPW